MKSTRYVLSDAGEVSIVRLDSGAYALDCIAFVSVGTGADEQRASARGTAIVRRDEAGFGGRDWIVEEAAIGGARDTLWEGTQHATLRDAAQALGRGAFQMARLRATIKHEQHLATR